MEKALLQLEVMQKGSVNRAADGLELAGKGDAVADGRRIVSEGAKRAAVAAFPDGDPASMDATARKALEATL